MVLPDFIGPKRQILSLEGGFESGLFKAGSLGVSKGPKGCKQERGMNFLIKGDWIKTIVAHFLYISL
ncbi:hypothetical protein HMPREF1407_01309 [Helicobacter pylori GAM244Ai]|nr:hypothetical protein HMPREF1407_01309 [Helicobacter pylori GAM244Ai]EMH17009.1 hypothetical protein HMPREF1415_01597 [Helicobacter pylori GAM254Ai]